MQANDPIKLRIYRGASGTFTLPEDEGDNYNYDKGKSATIPLSWNETPQTLTIGRRRGNFPGMLVNCTFRIIWVAADRGNGIALKPTAEAVANTAAFRFKFDFFNRNQNSGSTVNQMP